MNLHFIVEQDEIFLEPMQLTLMATTKGLLFIKWQFHHSRIFAFITVKTHFIPMPTHNTSAHFPLLYSKTQYTVIKQSTVIETLLFHFLLNSSLIPHKIK